MGPLSLEGFAQRQVLYLTTVGRVTGLLREIEIWFVVFEDKFYLFAEHFDAGWVKNIKRNPSVWVRIGRRRLAALARVLDRKRDRKLWSEVQRIANSKYGWGEGLPVEIAPLGAGL